MTTHLAILSSRNTTQWQALSSRETSWLKGVIPRHTTCINLILIKYCPRLHPSWRMDLLNSKDSFGKTMHASSLLKARAPHSLSSNFNWRTTSALTFNSFHCTSHKVLVKTPTESLVSHHTKTWARRSCITCGLSRTTELLIMPWSASVSLPKKWEKLHMLSSEDTTPLKLWVDQQDLRVSRASPTGLEHGH